MYAPIGIITNVAMVVVGGIIGSLLGNKISADFQEKLNMTFGVCAMAMGIYSISLMENMPAVVFSVIAGTCIGLAIHLNEWITKAAGVMQRFIDRFVPNPGKLPKEDYDQLMITAIVLFCASGTGIYGSIVSGMNGDQSILLSKSILDLPTALIFACGLGAVTCVIAVPQLIIFLLLFLLAGVIYPLTTPAMIADFKACGGMLLVATGFRMAKIKNFPLADMIPAMILVMPISWLWMTYVIPLVG